MVIIKNHLTDEAVMLLGVWANDVASPRKLYFYGHVERFPKKLIDNSSLKLIGRGYSVSLLTKQHRDWAIVNMKTWKATPQDNKRRVYV